MTMLLKKQAHKIAILRPVTKPPPPSHDPPSPNTTPCPQICPSDYRQHIIELQAIKNLLVILGFAFASCVSHAKRQVKKKN